MESFAFSYRFHHVTSSPRYPQSNGQAERTVQTVKRLMMKAENPYLVLLMYRSTPLSWWPMPSATSNGETSEVEFDTDEAVADSSVAIPGEIQRPE